MVRSENQVANPVRTNIELSEKVLELNKQLEQEPENAELWIKRGLALVEQNLMREAVESYSKALCLDPFTCPAGNSRKLALTLLCLPGWFPTQLTFTKSGKPGICWRCLIICWVNMKRRQTPTKPATAWPTEMILSLPPDGTGLRSCVWDARKRPRIFWRLSPRI